MSALRRTAKPRWSACCGIAHAHTLPSSGWERSKCLGQTCFEAPNPCHAWPHAVEFLIHDYSLNGQTTADEAAHIIVAAEVVNTSSDIQQLSAVMATAMAHTFSDKGQVLADAICRSKAVEQ